MGELNCLLSIYTFPQLYTLRSFGRHLDKSLFNKFLKEKIKIILEKSNQKENAEIIQKVFGGGNEGHDSEQGKSLSWIRLKHLRHDPVTPTINKN